MPRLCPYFLLRTARYDSPFSPGIRRIDEVLSLNLILRLPTIEKKVLHGFSQRIPKKLITAEEAAKIVKSGDWIDYSQCCSFPTDLDKALAARKDELTDVKVRNAISALPIAVVKKTRTRRLLRITSGTVPV